METLASVWACDPCDLSDLGQKRSDPSSVWESQCVFSGSPPAAAAAAWTEQLSPQLQRNKQLQDTLLQREEELARLQEENNKLREFLDSSFVRNLQQKAKKLGDGRRKLKRNLMFTQDGPFQNCSPQLPASQQVSKRVCRNLTAEFCAVTSETSSEPNLDLWVLRTLGLKDRDTIDTSNGTSSSPPYSLSSSSQSNLPVPPGASSSPPPVHNYSQRAPYQTVLSYSAEQANRDHPAEAPPGSDFTATGPARFGAPEAGIYNTLAAFQSAPATEPQAFTPSPDRAEVCSTQTLEEHQGKVFWSPPPQGGLPFSPISSSGPVRRQLWTPVRDGSPASPSEGSQPHSRTDLAFSMSLSPSSSVKTHSFPQGQAFIRKDPEGRWNFTWVPRQGP